MVRGGVLDDATIGCLPKLVVLPCCSFSGLSFCLIELELDFAVSVALWEALSAI